jgi:hypothetical protein
MTPPNITVNPALTSNALGSFNVSASGLVQGTAYPDPAIRYSLAGGILLAAETIPMWGGVGIYETVPNPMAVLGARDNLGPQVGRANSLTGSKALTAFSVFDQAYGMLNSPQSPVPLAASGGQVMYYRLGSKARIAVACDAALVSLQGGIINAQVSWDFTNQLLVPYNASALTISSGTYNNATGVVTLTMSAPINFGPGDDVAVSSLTGTGAFASLNGNFTALAGTTGSTVVYNAGAALGASTITGGSLSLGSGAGSALPVSVLDVVASNCMTVNYNATTGFATWNYSGACAVILI